MLTLVATNYIHTYVHVDVHNYVKIIPIIS